jgi:predicted RNA binding protein YcfA (HicA-like mRNA interferase family)
MTRAPKLLAKALARNKNLRFEELTALVEAFGFTLARTSGSHHVYARANVPELLNLQSVNGKAKPYQVRQFLELVEMYNLSIGDRP